MSCFVACVADDLVALPGPGSSAASVSGSSGGDPDRQELLAALRAGLDASAQLPADPAAGVSRQLVVGSLDLNVGHTLPSEELIGRQPKVCAPPVGLWMRGIPCQALGRGQGRSRIRRRGTCYTAYLVRGPLVGWALRM